VLGSVALAVVLVAAGLTLSALAGSPADVQPARSTGATVEVSSTPLADGGVVITILDVAQQRMAVYQADVKRSRLKLLAVRDISADMALTDYNNDPPLPREIRSRVDKGTDSLRPASETKEPSAAP
jgi:hypothetical protein